MATDLWSSVVDHTSDAGFRAWATELYARLIAIGLVQTADTGQLASSPVVAVRPGSGLAAGYWIFRFNDTHQATAPIFIKIEPGSPSATIPGFWVTMGTGTNGAGTINGTVFFARVHCGMTSGFHSPATPYASYLCLTDGFLGLGWKALTGSAAMGCGMFMVERSVDTNGDPTPDAVHVLYQAAGASAFARSFTYSTGITVQSAASQYALIPYAVTDSATVAGDFQLFQHVGIEGGAVRVLGYRVSCVIGEVPIGTTVTFPAVGTTPRTYINVGQAAYGAAGAGQTASVHGVCMRWE